MTPAWHTSLAKLIRDRFGFQLDGHGRNVLPLIEAHLQKTGQSPERWLERLGRAGNRDPELRFLVETFTIGETTFYRDGGQLDGIRSFLVDRYKARRRPLRVWSAACASGEEAYTLAILMADAEVPGTVTGTDLNEASLQVARSAGPYSGYRLMPVPADWRGRWFEQSGDGWTVQASLKSKVQFSPHNLLERALSTPGGWDAIVCRNVLIYFSPETAGQVVERLTCELNDDGALFLGASDPTLRMPSSVSRIRVGTRSAWRQGPSAPRLPPPSSGARAPASSGGALAKIQADLQRGPLDRARRQLDAMLTDNPGHAEARLERGAVLVALHEFSLGVMDLRMARRAVADNARAEADYLLGVAHLKKREDALAARALESSIERDARLWPAMVLLADIRRQQRRLLHAETLYEQALGLLRRGVSPRFSTKAIDRINSAHSSPIQTRKLVADEIADLQRAQHRAHAS